MDWKHNCGDPRSSDYNFELLPSDVRTEVTKKNLDKGDLKRCSYCGDIWIETKDYSNTPPTKLTTIIGVQDVNTKEMIWKILERTSD